MLLGLGPGALALNAPEHRFLSIRMSTAIRRPVNQKARFRHCGEGQLLVVGDIDMTRRLEHRFLCDGLFGEEEIDPFWLCAGFECPGLLEALALCSWQRPRGAVEHRRVAIRFDIDHREIIRSRQRIVEGGAWLTFASPDEGNYLILGEDGMVLGDVYVAKHAIKVAVAPGRYEVRKRTPAGERSLQVALRTGEERLIQDGDLGPPLPWVGPPKGAVLPSGTLIVPLLGDPFAAEQEMLRKERTGALLFLGLGAGFLASFGGSLGLIFSLGSDDNTAWIAPLACGLLMSSAQFFSTGGFALREASQSMEPSPLLDTRDPSVLLARAHDRGQRKRFVGGWLLGSGLVGLAVGSLVGGIGASFRGVVPMSIGFPMAAIGAGLSLTGAALYYTGGQELRRADSGVLEYGPNVRFQLAPVALNGGGGLTLYGSF